MRDWTLARVMWVADRGFSSAQNRRELRRGGGHYIIGEKLRSGSAEATAALSRQGRYQHVRDVHPDRQDVVYPAARMPRSWKRVCMWMRIFS